MILNQSLFVCEDILHVFSVVQFQFQLKWDHLKTLWPQFPMRWYDWATLEPFSSGKKWQVRKSWIIPWHEKQTRRKTNTDRHVLVENMFQPSSWLPCYPFLSSTLPDFTLRFHTLMIDRSYCCSRSKIGSLVTGRTLSSFSQQVVSNSEWRVGVE